MPTSRRSVLERLGFGLGALFSNRRFAPTEAQPRLEPPATPQVAAPAAPTVSPTARESAGGYIRPGTIETIHQHFELVVVGGGLSGVCAAISAARNGVQVALVHERSMLGGNSSSEVRLYPEDTCVHNTWCREAGIFDEIYTEERARNWVPRKEGLMNSVWDLTLYEWVKRERNITLFLNTTMREVEMADEQHILAIHADQLGTEKEFVLQAPLFIDCTGDGVLIYRSGAQFRTGKEARSEYGETLAPEQASTAGMGNTLYFRAYDTGHPVPFKRPEWAAEFSETDLADRDHGSVDCGYWWIELGYPMDWIRDNEEIRDVLLRQVLGVWDHVKNRCTDARVRERARNYALDFVGFWPYKRESRRLVGDYVLSEHDIRDPSIHPDDIAYGLWPMDIHAPEGVLGRHTPVYPRTWFEDHLEMIRTMPYGIPLRSCYSKNVANLLAAGRSLSASYVAFSSARVLPTAAITAQGVGIAAALCKKYHCGPRQVSESHAEELQQRLLRQDGSILGVDNRDPSDLARTASITASSDAPLIFPEGQEFYPANAPLAQIFPVSGARLKTIELLLKSAASSATRVRLGLRKAPHVWDFRSEEDLATAEASVPAGSEGYVPFVFDVAVKPGSLYYVHMEAHPEIAWSQWHDADGSASVVPVGVTPAERSRAKSWRPLTNGAAFTLRMTPQQKPYSATNVVRGSNRPDRWTNLWISDPERPLPAWIELKLPTAVEFNCVQITFDNNTNVRSHRPLFRFPECVKSYEVAAEVTGQWRTVATVTDNYHRRAVHTFPRLRSGRLRITIHETNGIHTARIYEVRIYNEAVSGQGEESPGSVISEKLAQEFHTVPSETL